MAKSPYDASFSTQIFRKDWAQIIAAKRELAKIFPVRLKYESGGYAAGQVLAYNTVSQRYEKYSGVSATYPAKAVLPFALAADEQVSTIDNASPAIFGGVLYADKLVDLSAQAITELAGKSYIDATSVTLFDF